MKRTKIKKVPSAIFISDTHLREDCPVCRTDNSWEAQSKKFQFIKSLQEKYQCPVLIPGDIFHHWKPSPFLLSWAIEHLPNNIIAIPGQHDLPQHNIELINKSGLFVLKKAGKIKILSERETINIGNSILIYGYPYGSKLHEIEKNSSFIKIAMCHILTWVKTPPFPGCEARDGNSLLKKLKGFDVVLVGDNHQPFVIENDGRILISPGSVMRMTADQVNHKPRIYLWYAETNTVESVYLPIKDNVISREHILHTKKRDERIDAFISKLNGNWESSISFEDNIKRFLERNDIPTSTKDIIEKAIDYE